MRGVRLQSARIFPNAPMTEVPTAHRSLELEGGIADGNALSDAQLQQLADLQKLEQEIHEKYEKSSYIREILLRSIADQICFLLRGPSKEPEAGAGHGTAPWTFPRYKRQGRRHRIAQHAEDTMQQSS